MGQRHRLGVEGLRGEVAPGAMPDGSTRTQFSQECVMEGGVGRGSEAERESESGREGEREGGAEGLLPRHGVGE